MANGSDDWTAWFDRHGAALVLFARQWAPDHTSAEDIVQEAFVRFWRSRHQANDSTAYLFACVRHCALDWQRSRQRQSKREEFAARTEAEPLFECPFEHAERFSALATALTELPEEQREVVIMKIWGDLSFAQIAEALGTSLNTTASRYRYGLDKLRRQLMEESIP
jgi:RNA polymerase sigma-70 factor (ECF subfamily)